MNKRVIMCEIGSWGTLAKTDHKAKDETVVALALKVSPSHNVGLVIGTLTYKPDRHPPTHPMSAI